jgi:hypothetical protein
MNLFTKPTAQQAGNSPAMLHGNYKGLATKNEAEQWFAVAPERAENIISQPQKLPEGS